MENSFAYLYDTTVVQETFDNQNLFDIISCTEHKTLNLKRRQQIHVEKKIYYILKGKVMTSRNGVILAIDGENNFIGLESLFTEDLSRDTFFILENAVLLEFDTEEALYNLLSLQEGWVHLILQEKRRQEQLTRTYVCIHKKGKEKLQYTLSYLAKEFGIVTDKGILIPKCFNKSIISNFANLTMNSLKRILDTLEKEGWLEIENNCLIIRKEHVESYFNFFRTDVKHHLTHTN